MQYVAAIPFSQSSAMSNLPLPIQALQQQESLHSLLWISLQPATTSTGQCLPPSAALEQSFCQRFDLVFVDASNFVLPKTQLMQLLAKARDLLSSKVVVEHPLERETDWQEADFLALAMRRRAVTLTEDGEHVFYSYDLKTYKTVPDWLNAKYWANPQMWGKARW